MVLSPGRCSMSSYILSYNTLQCRGCGTVAGRTHCGSCDHEVMGSNDAFSFFISLSFSLQVATQLRMNTRSFWKLFRLLTICATTNFELHFLPVPSKPSSINPFLINTSSEDFSSESRWLRDRKIAASVTFKWELKYCHKLNLNIIYIRWNSNKVSVAIKHVA